MLAVVEVPQRTLPDDADARPRRGRDREARATSARWRAPPTPPAPTRCSSPTREPTRGTRTRSARRPAPSSRCRSSRRRSTSSRAAAAEDRRRRRRADPLHRRRPDARRPRCIVGAEDEGLTRAGATSPTCRSRSRCTAHRRQPERVDRRRRPALRDAAPTWLTDRPRETTSYAHARRSATASSRTPLLSSRTLGARLKCELFQRTGSFKSRGALNKMQQPHRRGEAARRDRDQRRQPRAGRRVRRRAKRTSTRSS